MWASAKKKKKWWDGKKLLVVFFGGCDGGVEEHFKSLQIVMKLIPGPSTEVCYLIELLMDTNSVPSTSVA